MERRKILRLFGRLCRQPRYTFPAQREKLPAPHTPGVYVIYDAKSRVVHVGRTPAGRNDLHKRLNDHLCGASSFTQQYLKGEGSQLRGVYSFQYLEVPAPRQRALLEALAIGSLCPQHLGLGVPPGTENAEVASSEKA